ncbi:MAG: redoxin domain-containing protein [bacterium]|nr:redoxin domain-containing protein [bacterium]
MFCREHVAQLRDASESIESLGASVVVVGNGTPAEARAFREESAVLFPVFVDPDRGAYAAAELRRGVKTALAPRSVRDGLRALRSGHRQSRLQGDAWQQGGVLVIVPGDGSGELVYHHADSSGGDHAPLEAILAALGQARA